LLEGAEALKIKFRDPISGLTHLFSAFLAAVGLIFLLFLGRGDANKEIALFVYGLSLILMLSSSAAYHLANARPAILIWLRKMDHTAIYLLIAGTYTPVCLYYFTGFWRNGFLAIIWGMALIGIIVKLFIIRAPRWVTAGIYLLMGWLSILALREILTRMPAPALFWLALGGLAYTLGAVVYILKKPDIIPGVFGFHEVWHIFVILGCLAHFILIAVFIAPSL
jgi:hemolysin III